MFQSCRVCRERGVKNHGTGRKETNGGDKTGEKSPVFPYLFCS